MTASPDLDRPVWYAAYGSNLSSARFRTYLEGGTVPHSPNERPQQGARDSSAPTGNGPCEINRRLVFSGTSTRWGGGGVAFLDPDSSVEPEFPALGRAWRITLGQFEDLFKQENRLDEVMSIDLGRLTDSGVLELLPGGYGRLELLSQMEGDPVLTFTRPTRPTELNAADISYLKVMTDGLIETWSIEPEDAARYLASLEGNAGAFEIDQLIADLMEPDQ